MKEIIDFLGRLSQNNDREWFNAHKDEYIRHKAKFDEFVGALIEGIRQFDDTIGPLTVKDCTYRIYRDTRFSADKTPYKTHIGAFICPKGKKSGYAGYYFQIGPDDKGYDSGCMLATGNYCYEPRVLSLLREDIALDEAKEFESVLRAAKGFTLDFDSQLKRVPVGYDAEAPYAKWLRLKNFCLVREPGVGYMQAPDLLERVLSDFRRTRRFLAFVNRAISYAHDEQ